MRKYLTIVMLFLSATLFAQQHSVKGNVVDQNGLPVIGMTVLEQGTQNGTVTDVDGNYQISVLGGATLEFTALGYQTIVEPVNGRAVINVVSAEEAIALDAVVAIGYGSVRKRDLTTAVSTVSTEDMKLRPVKELKGFKKIALEPGQKQTVTFEITPDILKFFDAEKHDWVLEKGKFTAFIGSASDDIRTQVEFEVI